MSELHRDEIHKQLTECYNSAQKSLNSTGEFQVVYHSVQDNCYLFCPEWVWDIFAQFGYPKSEFYCLVTY